jgi:hypothetical protein
METTGTIDEPASTHQTPTNPQKEETRRFCRRRSEFFDNNAGVETSKYLGGWGDANTKRNIKKKKKKNQPASIYCCTDA